MILFYRLSKEKAKAEYTHYNGI